MALPRWRGRFGFQLFGWLLDGSVPVIKGLTKLHVRITRTYEEACPISRTVAVRLPVTRTYEEPAMIGGGS